MILLVLAVMAALIAYGGAMVVTLGQFLGKTGGRQKLALGLTVAGMLCHGALLAWLFQPSRASDLRVWDAIGVASIVAAAVALLLDRGQSRQPIVLPALLGAALMVALFPLLNRPAEGPGPDLELTLHLIASVTAFALLTLATLQATFALAVEHRLRYHESISPLQRVPSLESMERVTFRLIWTGVALLTLSIASGLVFLADREFSPLDRFHAVFSVGAWGLYGSLLAGRWHFGWRGAVATGLALAAFAMLVGGYFGAKFVLMATPFS